MRWLKFGLLAACTLLHNLSAGAAEPAPPLLSPADSLCLRAEVLLAAGDTSGANLLLERALALDDKHTVARLARGSILLAGGDLRGAETEFKYALFTDIDSLKSLAFMGLGDIEATRPKHNWEAIKQYRIAALLNPSDLRVCLKATRCALAMGTPEGFATADEYLRDIICLDPFYNEAYKLWRDTVLVKTGDGLRQVSECLERYIESNHGPDSLWLDIASFRYRCGDIELSLEALKKLCKAAPEFKPVERHLWSARCQVELYDLDKFQAAYDSALDAAGRTGEFSTLVSQASAIFRPEEIAKADTLTTTEQWTDFFRVFWGRRDPDPMTPENERMFEHYKRLREAERTYTIKNPYSKIWDSRDRYRHVSMNTINQIYQGNSTDYDYDPDLFFDRNKELWLEQRGLLYIRHGQPDEIERLDNLESADAFGVPGDEEIWRYGDKYFVFSPGKVGPSSDIFSGASIGEYFFVPFSLRGSADINRAMETESYADMLPELEQDFYTVDFMAPGGLSELESYQAVSAADVEIQLKKPPSSELALYDQSWHELARDSSAAFQAIFDGKVYWLGINSLTSEPGEKIFAARLDIPGRRAVRRHSMLLSPFGGGTLDLSGVVLGSPVAPGEPAHSRLGTPLLPRPSLEYTAGEMMTVYLEIYGLQATSYTEKVTVTRIREIGVLGQIKKLLTSMGRERSSSMTLTFEREGVAPARAVPESFSVDTSLLLSGEYRMTIEIEDPLGGASRKVGCTFKLVEPE